MASSDRGEDLDFRMKVGFFKHPKTKKLIRRIGKGGAFALLELIAHARTKCPTTGRLDGYSDEDIALAADFDGDPKAFIDALLECRWIDGTTGERTIHDWPDHQPHAANTDRLSMIGKQAADARWAKARAMQTASEAHANGMRTASEAHAVPNAPPFLPSDQKKNPPLTPPDAERMRNASTTHRRRDCAACAVLGDTQPAVGQALRRGEAEPAWLCQRHLENASQNPQP